MFEINLTYDIAVWHILVLIVLLIFFAALEWKRKKRNRIARVIAVSMALISLYIIYLRPFTFTEKPIKSVVLIGENVSKSLSDYLSKFSDYEVLYWDAKTHLLQSRNRKRAFSFNQLDYSIDTLFIRGYLPPVNPAYYQHLVNADTVKLKYEIEFPDKIDLGDTITLQVKNTSAETILLDGKIGVDTLKNQSLNTGKEFVYNYIPKTKGFHQSNLIIDENSEYNFSTLVEERRKYIFHLLAETPDFEWRFLKDFLAEEGHAVYLRSKISKNKFKTDFVNWPDSLNRQLRTYDPQHSNILVTDMEAWNGLGINSRAKYIAQLKKEQGVLLIRANENERLNLKSIEAGLNDILVIGENTEEYEGVKMLKINKLNNFTVNNELLLSYAVLPELSIGIISLQDTYVWPLSGKNEIYSDYWTHTFNQLLRDPAKFYYHKTNWPVQFQPFHFQLWSGTGIDSITIVNENQASSTLPLIQDKLYPERQHLVYYPATIGWHQIVSENQTIIDQFYVHPEQTSSQNLMDLSYKYQYNNYLNQFSSTEQINSSNNKVKSLIFWFFLLFLLSISFLWIEEKI